MPVGKPHVQATPQQVKELWNRLERLKEKNELVRQYWDTVLTDQTLRRFITARNGNIGTAEEVILQHLQWRVKERIDGILSEDFSDIESDREMYWDGVDVMKHPVLVWRVRRHDPQRHSVDRQVRFFIYLLEKGFDANPEAEQFVAVLDCAQMPRKAIDTNLLRIAAPILETNYPERQYASYVLPVGTIIRFAWGVVSNFLDPGTVFKVRLVDGYDHADCRAQFSREQLQALKRDAAGAAQQEAAKQMPVLLSPHGVSSSGMGSFSSEAALPPSTWATSTGSSSSSTLSSSSGMAPPMTSCSATTQGGRGSPTSWGEEKSCGRQGSSLSASINSTAGLETGAGQLGLDAGEEEAVSLGSVGDDLVASAFPPKEGVLYRRTQHLHSDVWNPCPVVFQWEPPQPPCLCCSSNSGAATGPAEEGWSIALRDTEVQLLPPSTHNNLFPFSITTKGPQPSVVMMASASQGEALEWVSLLTTAAQAASIQGYMTAAPAHHHGRRPSLPVLGHDPQADKDAEEAVLLGLEEELIKDNQAKVEELERASAEQNRTIEELRRALAQAKLEAAVHQQQEGQQRLKDQRGDCAPPSPPPAQNPTPQPATSSTTAAGF